MQGALGPDHAGQTGWMHGAGCASRPSCVPAHSPSLPSSPLHRPLLQVLRHGGGPRVCLPCTGAVQGDAVRRDAGEASSNSNKQQRWVAGPCSLKRMHRNVRAVHRCRHPWVSRGCCLTSWPPSDPPPPITLPAPQSEAIRRKFVGPDGQPTTFAYQVATDIGLGVAALHERGIVHRDLKPQNVLLTEGGRWACVGLGSGMGWPQPLSWAVWKPQNVLGEGASWACMGLGSGMGWQLLTGRGWGWSLLLMRLSVEQHAAPPPALSYGYTPCLDLPQGKAVGYGAQQAPAQRAAQL